MTKASAAAAVAVVALIGCPRGKPDQPAATVTCDGVGAAYARDLAATAGTPEPHTDAINRALIAALVESCTVDAWSPAARGCFVDTNAAAAENCRTLVSDAQLQALEDRMDSAVAKAAPAACSELEPLITASFVPELERLPAADRAALEAKIATFAAAVGAMCTGGWSVEARTCFRDMTRAGEDAARCARWLDAAQGAAYQAAVEAAFGQPPDGDGASR